ncbi:hypothetical protein CKR_0302 [Clostridium kluyveri NBRC 12016]|uniref:Uncharacterized protein n=1 Tax=Clostridium kluyveri (strain NBRC 12016) TaxID=583346 RepID=B9DYM8_CLOK1|nr:hypothetical protein CKR_0302 [Clostridium kluyveri NBRC 12016]
MYQCAEIASIALGLGILCAILDQLAVYSLFSMAFIGEPCPINNAGILSVVEFFKLISIIPYSLQYLSNIIPDDLKINLKFNLQMAKM